MNARVSIAGAAVAGLLIAPALQAHDGPPYPILSNHAAGPYVVSIWTDPDTTDDGSPGGQFWVRVHLADGGAPPAGTRAIVTVAPLDRAGASVAARASPVRGDITNQFAAVVMDHEGRFGVRVSVDGPLGEASASATVEATYDLRPAPGLLVLYLVPFAIVGLLWGRLLMRRRT